MSENKNRPKDTKFRQQTLNGFQPIYTSKLVSIIFFTAAILFYSFGFPLYVLSERVVEVSKRYDDCEADQYGNCTINIKIDKKIPSPVYVYYKLENFYQNHRLYVRSRSYMQLRDGKPTNNELNLCEPAKKNKDMLEYFEEEYKDTLSKDIKDIKKKLKSLDEDDVAIPCGMIARSIFNDKFSFKSESDNLSIDFDDLVYESDKNIWKQGDKKKQWIDINDKLRIWMKISPFSTFRKLYGVIDKDIKKGTIQLKVENNYKVDEWNGKKSIVLSNASTFGGKNNKLGIIFITAGCVCIFCAMMFMVLGLLSKKIERISESELKKLKF
jgi:uncharacterized protein YdeI (BOF family)